LALPEIGEACRPPGALEIAPGRVTPDAAGRELDAGFSEAGVCDIGASVLLSAGEGGSFSSSESESESSLSEAAPTVEGLLEGESGLSGPSSSSFSSSASGCSDAFGAAIALVAGSCRRTRLGITFTGDGRRS
jgi:hypothetical protein